MIHLRYPETSGSVCGAPAWAGDELQLTDSVNDCTCRDCLADAPAANAAPTPADHGDLLAREARERKRAR